MWTHGPLVRSSPRGSVDRWTGGPVDRWTGGLGPGSKRIPVRNLRYNPLNHLCNAKTFSFMQDPKIVDITLLSHA